MKKCRAMAYSSTANLGPGFDILGMAVKLFHDEVEIEILENTRGIKINVIDNEGNVKISRNAKENTAGLAAERLIEEFQLNKGLKMTIKKGIPAGYGLGSSGASAAAAVVAIDSLFHLDLNDEEKIKYAMFGETASSGTAHADNVAPSILGGLVALTSLEPLKFIKLNLDKNLEIRFIVPKLVIEQKTKIAREILPKNVELKEHVRSTMRLLGLIDALANGDIVEVKRFMVDNIVEESRLRLFTYYESVRSIANQFNNVAVALSGAGPSILVISKGSEITTFINVINDYFNDQGIMHSVLSTEVAPGASVLT